MTQDKATSTCKQYQPQNDDVNKTNSETNLISNGGEVNFKLAIASGICLFSGWLSTFATVLVFPSTLCRKHYGLYTTIVAYAVAFFSLLLIIMSSVMLVIFYKSLIRAMQEEIDVNQNILSTVSDVLLHDPAFETLREAYATSLGSQNIRSASKDENEAPDKKKETISSDQKVEGLDEAEQQLECGSSGNKSDSLDTNLMNFKSEGSCDSQDFEKFVKIRGVDRSARRRK